MKLFLFDCDGTLVDSGGLIHEVMVRTFEHFDVAPPVLADTKGIIGLTLDIAIARLLGQPHVDDRALVMTAHYKAIYAGVRDEGYQESLFPGVDALLRRLASEPDIRVGAVTGKSRRGLDHIIKDHKFEGIFFVSRTADDCPSKPHPAMVTECCMASGIEPEDTIVIGDAVFDMQMAKAAGARAVGVSWGYAPVPALQAAGADRIVTDAAEILDFMEHADG